MPQEVVRHADVTLDSAQEQRAVARLFVQGIGQPGVHLLHQPLHSLQVVVEGSNKHVHDFIGMQRG